MSFDSYCPTSEHNADTHTHNRPTATHGPLKLSVAMSQELPMRNVYTQGDSDV